MDTEPLKLPIARYRVDEPLSNEKEKERAYTKQHYRMAIYTHHTSRCEHRCINNVKPISDSFSQ